MLEPVRQQSPLPSLLLAEGRYTLGSAEDCTVRVQAVGVESASLRDRIRPAGRFSVRREFADLAQQKTVKRTALQPGDHLAIGPVEFRIRTATRENLLRIVPEHFSREVAKPAVGHSPLETAPDDGLRSLLSGLRNAIAPHKPTPPRSAGWVLFPPHPHPAAGPTLHER